MRKYYALYVAYDSMAGEYTRPIIALSDAAAIERYTCRMARIYKKSIPPMVEGVSRTSLNLMTRSAASAFMAFCKAINLLKAGRFNAETANVEMFDIYEPLGCIWDLLPGEIRKDVESRAMK